MADKPIQMPDIYIGGDKGKSRKVGNAKPKGKPKGSGKYKATQGDKSRYFASTKVV